MTSNYAGGIYDKDTALTLFGVRSYDPSVGCWLSKDPIFFDGADTNLFGYVQNDPINWIDPSGLYKFAPGAKGPLSKDMDQGLQCFEKCVGQEVTVTSGQRDGSKGPHGTGEACDLGGNANPGVSEQAAKTCFQQCFNPASSFGQKEDNVSDIGGTHFHFQSHPGKGGAMGYKKKKAPYTPL